jgi:putative FmdB family regulatory protein
MPLYEYRCTSCGHAFEVIQKFSDRPLRKCRQCAGRLEKLISRSSFTLKGGGWYSDDYGKTSARPGAKTTGKPKGSGSAPKAKADSGSASKSTGGTPEKTST